MNNPTLSRPLPAVRWAPVLAIIAALLMAYAGATALTPRETEKQEPPSLAATLPSAFGGWVRTDNSLGQVDPSITRQGEKPSANQPYDEVVARNYQDSSGRIVMLTVAYGRSQRQEVKIHRPELCYRAQGFKILDLAPARIGTVEGSQLPIAGKRMLAEGSGHLEAVSYWVRIGSLYSEDAVATRMHIFTEGVAGRIPDGVLVRASMVVPGRTEAQSAYPVLESFLAQLTAAAPPSTRTLLVH